MNKFQITNAWAMLDLAKMHQLILLTKIWNLWFEYFHTCARRVTNFIQFHNFRWCATPYRLTQRRGMSSTRCHRLMIHVSSPMNCESSVINLMKHRIKVKMWPKTMGRASLVPISESSPFSANQFYDCPTKSTRLCDVPMRYEWTCVLIDKSAYDFDSRFLSKNR